MRSLLVWLGLARPTWTTPIISLTIFICPCCGRTIYHMPPCWKHRK